MAKAYFAAGCFWGIEAEFRKLKGVKDTKVGYCGGAKKDPSYEQVCTGKTGHAETVEVTYDPKKIKYEKLLETFWNIHNPTTLNRQGFDLGTQYRSAIFYTTEAQKEKALKSKKEFQKQLKKKIVTTIEKAKSFYLAEEYHQRYLEKHGKASCRVPQQGFFKKLFSPKKKK